MMALSEHISQMKRDIAMLKKQNLDKLKKHDDDYNRKHNSQICRNCGDVLNIEVKKDYWKLVDKCLSCGHIANQLLIKESK